MQQRDASGSCGTYGASHDRSAKVQARQPSVRAHRRQHCEALLNRSHAPSCADGLRRVPSGSRRAAVAHELFAYVSQRGGAAVRRMAMDGASAVTQTYWLYFCVTTRPNGQQPNARLSPTLEDSLVRT